MNIKFNWQEGSIKWLDSPNINANDIAWHKLTVVLTPSIPQPTKTIWVAFSQDETDFELHTLCAKKDSSGAQCIIDIPDEVIKQPGDWSLQLCMRESSATDPTKYKQRATSITGFTVENGLRLDDEETPATEANVRALLEQTQESAQRIDALESIVGDGGNEEYESRIADLEQNFANYEALLGQMDERVDSLEKTCPESEYLDEVETRLTALEQGGSGGGGATTEEVAILSQDVAAIATELGMIGDGAGAPLNPSARLYDIEQDVTDLKNETLAFIASEDQYSLSDDEKTAVRDKIGAVGATDYATADKAGVVKVFAEYGTQVKNERLALSTATTGDIEKKTNAYKPIAPNAIDIAVKVGITTNTKTLTDEEKAAAQAWLGITSGGSSAGGGTQLYKHALTITIQGAPTFDGPTDTTTTITFLSPKSTVYSGVMKDILTDGAAGNVSGLAFDYKLIMGLEFSQTQNFMHLFYVVDQSMHYCEFTIVDDDVMAV